MPRDLTSETPGGLRSANPLTSDHELLLRLVLVHHDRLPRHPRVRIFSLTDHMKCNPTRSPARMIEDRKTGSFT